MCIRDSTTAYFYFDFLMRGRFSDAQWNYEAEIEENRTSPVSGGGQGQNGANEPSVSSTRKRSSPANVRQFVKTHRRFFYCPYIYHPGLSNSDIKKFFLLCRQQNVSFDLERKEGCSVVLPDDILKGVLSLIAIGESRKTIVKYMVDALNHISNYFGQVSITIPDNKRIDYFNINHLVAKVREINKMNETRAKENN
eukprot:TRINITY_DN12969_c0_g1_i1.p1 TRINITY_DN12969_c0_g1~~TRINITY_DN12969_c0_g1_i1.p1  ORF type:complete len:196 (-),score=37.18 TRINITY_DN12969_c0_g1_i1:122-709(-)